MLKFVTLTGADDSISPSQLFDISKEFPFVEWGILLSPKHRDTSRFPSSDWLDVIGMDYDLLTQVNGKANFSLHLCGGYVRDFLGFGGDDFGMDIGADLFEVFKRIQINTHAETHQWDLQAIADVIKKYPDKEFIFQLDGNNFNEAHARRLPFDFGCSNVAFLLDTSHGAGILPTEWLMPPIANVNTGYAGGIGPDNLAEIFIKGIQPSMALRTDFVADYWIDMETKIRTQSGDGDIFDLEKCRKVLDIASQWFQKPATNE